MAQAIQVPLEEQRIEAYTPSPMEQQRQGIASFLSNTGLVSDPYRAQQLGEDFSFLAEMLPGVGDATGVAEGMHMFSEGDRLGGGIMMAASLTPFIPGSSFARAYQNLAKKIKKARFDLNREINSNMSSEPIDAMNAIENLQEQIRRYQKEQSRLINNAPDEAFDEIAKEMVDEAPVTPPEGRFQDALLGDIVKANEALGTPTPPKEDLLTKLQNLEMYKNRPSRKK